MQAPVDIRYEGAILAKGVAPTGSLEDGGTLFVPLADPMPVGTRLELHTGREVALVRVVRVTESADPATAGISVRPAGVPESIEVFPVEPEPVPGAVILAAPAAVAPAPRAPVGPVGAIPEAPLAVAPSGAVSRGNGAPRSPTGASAVVGAAEAPDPDGGDATDSEDTGSTSEYPALSNGAGTKRKRKTRKPR